LPLVSRLLMRLHVIGQDNVPQTGPLILMSNHLDNWDPYICNLTTGFRAVHHLARADGMASRGLGSYWRLLGALPANGEGLRSALRILACGGCVGVYPEGHIAPALTRAGHGAAILALRSGAPVVPVAVWGTEQVHLSSLIKRPKVTICYGPARTVLRGSASVAEVSEGLMTEIAGMLPPQYRGEYTDAVERSPIQGQGIMPAPCDLDPIVPQCGRSVSSGQQTESSSAAMVRRGRRL
jgi:1-acyl-sn-glycerol-3-phosphate acyltransferase